MARRASGPCWLRAMSGAAGGLLCGLIVAACSANGPNPLAANAALPSPADLAPSEKKQPIKVALLVPLSAQGQSGVIGKSLKQAAELALFERDNPSLQLIVKDDKGTPEGAKAAAEEAVKGGAQLILGPLFAKSATAVAPVARQANVPVIAFSTDRQVAGGGVYLLSFQPAPEVTRVVAYAAQQGKLKFAALIPEDAFGKLAAAAFTEAVSRAGGTVVALETYPSSPNGVLEPMRKISAGRAGEPGAGCAAASPGRDRHRENQADRYRRHGLPQRRSRCAAGRGLVSGTRSARLDRFLPEVRQELRAGAATDSEPRP